MGSHRIFCVVPGCNKNNRTSQPGETFHCFPQNDKMRLQWIRNIGKPELANVPVRSMSDMRVCGAHFHIRDFQTPAKKKLNRHAIPLCASAVSEETPVQIVPEEIETVINTSQFSQDTIPSATSEAQTEESPILFSLMTEKNPKLDTLTYPKPSPSYSFDGRFNVVKKHDHLKSLFTENRKKLSEVTEKHDELNTRNEILTSELKKANEDLLNLRLENVELKAENYNLKTELQQMQDENNITKANLILTVGKNNKLKSDLNQNLFEFNHVVNSNKDLTMNLEQCNKMIENLAAELHNLDISRRDLHNEIQKLKGNIRLFGRVKPPLPKERDKFLCKINYIHEKCLEIEKENEGVKPNTISNSSEKFFFDKVFTSHTTQEEIFAEVSQLVISALDGYNVCIFAYGQTGSGKTYSMNGDLGTMPGIIPRSVDLIFNSMPQLKKRDWTYTVRVSFLEIHKECSIDLLSTTGSQPEILMTYSKENDVHVANLTMATISTAEEFQQLMKLAQNNRTRVCGENNERLTQSHFIAKIILEGVKKSKNEKLTGSLNLVDLAGSDNIHMSTSPQLKTDLIYKSLLNLKRVVFALVQNEEHIPYRNSKLTHLLMPCFGGNSKTLILMNLLPFIDCYKETMNTLKFSESVMKYKVQTL